MSPFRPTRRAIQLGEHGRTVRVPVVKHFDLCSLGLGPGPKVSGSDQVISWYPGHHRSSTTGLGSEKISSIDQ